MRFILQLLFIIPVILCVQSGFSQITYTGGGGQIPDDGNSIDFPLNVSFLNPPNLDTVNFGIESVCITITHPYDADLDVSLVAPDGTTILLTSANGGSGNNYMNTCFLNTAGTSIVAGNPPFTGNYRPQGQLGLINNGQNGNGTWNLHILDTYPFADQGNLISWNITFSNNPAIPYTFSSSNLPIIKINTNGQAIVNDPKITADMGIINNGPGIRNYLNNPFNDYEGKIGIELRGNSSLGFPQKSYSLETRDSLGNNLNVSLLGLPPENDWILYGPYTDKTLIRNVLAYKLSNDMGHYASRTVCCELLINDEYKGVFILIERIKRDVNRVNIAMLTAADSAGDNLTGGYMLKIDWVSSAGWVSSYPPVQPNTLNNTIFLQYVYPRDYEITSSQENYIQAYVDSMEDALASPNFTNPLSGFRKYADASSFIDYYLVNEISKNVDAYRLSTFLYKERNSLGGKIHMGPVWDFNLAFRNADYCNAEDYTGWALNITNYCQADIPFWFGRMLQDTNYTNQLRCRFDALRSTLLDTTNLFHFIDSMALYLNEAQQRHYETWPILGIYVWPNPQPLPTTYQGEIENLKLWLKNRLMWMDLNLPGHCNTTGLFSSATQNITITVFPNPSDGAFRIEVPGPHDLTTLTLSDITGKSVFSQILHPASKNLSSVSVSGLAKGVYILTVKSAKQSGIRKLVVQ